LAEPNRRDRRPDVAEPDEAGGKYVDPLDELPLTLRPPADEPPIAWLALPIE
jgi:hypothetical protein